MRAIACLLLLVATAACSHRRERAPVSTPSWASAPIDTIVLYRTRCFGRCPAYELTIPRGGEVDLRGDKALGLVRQVPDATLDALGRQALASGFYTLPSRIASDPTLCAARRTDQPTLGIRIVQGRERTEVEYYTGCAMAGSPPRIAPALDSLAAFARAIDAAAGIAAPR